jgi:chromate transporter
MTQEADPSARPAFSVALRLWLKIGCIGFGGPAGQIAILHREVVEQRNWIGEEQFERALKFCTLLPGPEAQQLATWIGWRLHGMRGGIAAGTLFVLPAALLLWALGLLYVMGRDFPVINGFFYGIKPVVVVLVVEALWKLGRRMISSAVLGAVAAAAFGLFLLGVSYFWVVIGSGLLGAFLLKEKSSDSIIRMSSSQPVRCGFSPVIAFPILWVLPVLSLGMWLGWTSVPVRVALLYAKAAVLSFGGAYAALSYVAFHASGDWGWLTPGQMLDGIGLAETTPGPLLIALQFVAFVAAWNHPGVLSPLVSATLASAAAVWSLFLPSFLWIFSLAPHMERIAANRRMAGALSVIGAVVTAVIAKLALWFAASLFFPVTPEGFVFRWVPVAMAFGAWLLLRSNHLGMIPIILLGGGVGVLLKLAGMA